MRAQVFTTTVENKKCAYTWVVEEHDFVNETVVACEGRWASPLRGPVSVLEDQSSCTEDDVQTESLQVGASALGYRYTLVRSLRQQDA